MAPPQKRLWIGFEIALCSDFWLIGYGVAAPRDPAVRGRRFMIHLMGVELAVDIGLKVGG